jgi:hypothetical protein
MLAQMRSTQMKPNNIIGLAVAFAILLLLGGTAGWFAVKASERGKQIQRDQAFVGAASNGDTGQMEALLAHGEDVNAASFDRTSGLWTAAANRRLPVVRLLLRHGANTEMPSQFGQMPLEAAVDNLGMDTGTAEAQTDAAIIRLLISHGASVAKIKQNAASVGLLKTSGIKI